MKYNPLTKTLYADDLVLIKKLHCPLAKNWQDLTQTSTLNGKTCDSCQTTVLETSFLKDQEVQQLVLNDPHSCLKVDLNQNNITITYKVHEE
jgi:hypothetical protein